MNFQAYWFRIGLLAATMLLVASCGTTAEHPSSVPTGTPVAVVAAVTAIPPLQLDSPTREILPSPTPAASPTASAVPEPTVEPSATTASAADTTPLTATTIPDATRQQIFSEVWKTIDEQYLYADFRGLDWAAVYDEFAPQVAAATTNEDFYQLLSTMVGRLNDNHSRVLLPSAAQREDVLSSGREEQVGIGVITLPLADALFIQHVFPDSPAERAGLRARDRIVAIDGAFYARHDIQGPEGSIVRLTVLRPGEDTRDIMITRHFVEGRITPDVRLLPGDVAYLGITTLWVGDMADQVGEALAQLQREQPLNGVIIDLRRNPGGWRDVLTGILGHFVEGPVGNFFSRKGELPLEITPKDPFLGDVPLVVLIDGGTASYAELIAGVLQQEAQAVVIGTPSAGNTETIYSYELTGGARLWVAQEGFRLLNGTNLEGLGVQPDTVLSLDWTRYSEDADPWILEGLRAIEAANAQE